MQNHRSATLLNTSRFSNDDLPEYVEAAAREIYTALSTFLRSPTIINPVSGEILPWVSEIRIPSVVETSKKTGKVYNQNTEAAWFGVDGIDDITVQIATQWCQPPKLLGTYDKHAQGIYWCINPVTPSHLEHYGTDLQCRKTGLTRDVDIIARYWLPIDADALRVNRITGAQLSVVSSTSTEKASIGKLISIARDWLCGTMGWPEPVSVDTGNGYALYYALPGIPIPRVPDPKNPGCLMYDEANDTLIKDVLNTISARYISDRSTSGLGDIDTAVFNPSRIMKVPGTIARKALHSIDRPHRASRILSIPESIKPVTPDQLRVVAGLLPKVEPKVGSSRAKTRAKAGRGTKAKVESGAGPEPGPGPEQGGPREPTSEAERTTRIDRAKSYLDKVPHAISGVHNNNGQKGHDATISSLGKVVRRFSLTREMALEAIIPWNEKCEPPWSVTEINHKLDDIYKDTTATDWGQFLNDSVETRQATIPYLTHNGVISIIKIEEDEEGVAIFVPTPLCNFDARITSAMHCNMGAYSDIEYKIRASLSSLSGETLVKLITINASEFLAMNWPVERLGGDWAVGSGRNIKDSLREAIQLLSGIDGIRSYAKYNHTGWVNHLGNDYYLHKGGAIGKDGVVLPDINGFMVDLGGALPLHVLPEPHTGNQLKDDVQATLRLRDIGRTNRPNARGIAAATVALPWRAVLGACNFSVVLAGGSGGGKTSLGCLVTQHFAPDHAYDSVSQAPVTWEATVASLEWLAHTAKDTVLVIDNFIADAAKASAQQAKAAAILSNQGDLRGRERMGPDMKPLPSLSPRGGLLSTGEDTAARGSAKGRSLLVSVTRGETPATNSVAHATLTPLQADAAAGAYARTMAAYIQHVASRGLNHQLDRLKQLTTEFRDRAMREEVHGHARTPGILADLAAGYRLFLEWADTVIADLDLVAASEEHWKWLCTLAPDQAEQQEEADDALRWRDLVHSALTVGRAYITGPTGAVPTSHQAECGWNVTIWQEKNKQITHWEHPETTRIGWFDGETIYLDENETTLVVQQMATQQRNQISQPATVKNRLVEKGWLQAGTEAGKTRYTTKSPIPLEGTRRRVWKIAAPHFWPDN